ncbi:hypothetical protein M8J75_003497 [Diaphorina citri]|nr:hypothetical protein M8J75_003497 [Diaphorina citri]
MFIPTEPVTLGVSAGVMTQTTAVTSQHTRLPWQHYNHDLRHAPLDLFPRIQCNLLPHQLPDFCIVH